MLAFFTNYIMDRNILFENIIKLEETSFQNQEIIKTSNKYGNYFEKVVKNILELEPVYFYPMDDGEYFAFDSEDDEKYKAFEAALNEMRSETDYKKKVELFEKYTGIKWNKIDKDPYSVNKHSGKTMSTEMQESIQGVFIAAMISENFEILHTSKGTSKKAYWVRDGHKVDIYDNSLYNGSVAGLHCSAIKSGTDLKDFIHQMEMLGMVLNAGLPKDIAALKGKPFAVLHPDMDCDVLKGIVSNPDKFRKSLFINNYIKLTPSTPKDAFAPADLYILDCSNRESVKAIEERLNDMCEFGCSPNDFSDFTNTWMKAKVLFPVSLKMGNAPQWHLILNADAESLKKYNPEDIVEVNFNLTGNSTLVLSDDSVFEFRCKGSKDNQKWQCTAKLKGSTTAYDGGGAKTYMKIAFEGKDLDRRLSDEEISMLFNWPVISHLLKEEDKILMKGEDSYFFAHKKSDKANPHSSAQGCLGMANFLFELMICQSPNEKFTYVVRHAFKKADDVQDTYKLMDGGHDVEIVKLTELNQSEFNRLASHHIDQRARGSVSTKDKWNLKMDIAELKGDLIDLQNTASDLPDEFVDEICDTESYPFEQPIDDDLALNNWCNEMDAFLSQDLDNWGSKKN